MQVLTAQLEEPYTLVLSALLPCNAGNCHNEGSCHNYFPQISPTGGCRSQFCLRGYTYNKFIRDVLAGITVGLVALPLAMAFAIASGLTPQAGIYCAIVTGFLISALGGSKTQIGGPTGAFVVVVAGIARPTVWMDYSCAQ